MKKYLELILLIVVMGFVAIAKTEERQSPPPPYVLMVSFDGFRYDYVEKFNAPNFKDFIKNGVAAEAMIPSFPSKTFPNHYTLVTGLYPGHHNLVDNSFYDRELEERYSIGNRSVVENPAFYGGLPLWQLVQKNGMKSASYFWVGSEAPIQGSFPDYYHIYNGDIQNDERISAVIDWLKLPEKERPHFVSLYFSLVDSQGHATGPNAKETGEAVLEADRLLGLLMTRLKEVELPVNVIVTSDHGMNEVPSTAENLINIDAVMAGIEKSDYQLVSSGALAHLYIDDTSKVNPIYQSLKKRENDFKVYRKQDFPSNWHYDNPKSGEVLIVVAPDHYLTTTNNKYRMVQNGRVHGQHGFDPYTTKDMGAIFYAAGPSFKRGITIGTFENVHVYPLVAHILGIDQLPKIDGKLEVLLGALQN